MFYRILKFLVSTGITFYYKRILCRNKKFLEQDAPMILIANHPNTLMDAWMIGHVTKQPIYFMAKGTLFNSKFKLWLLRNLNMIPINRAGEGRMKGVSNTDSFEACYKILEEGKTLMIFPEGSSFQERILRELKSGTARIALETERRNGGKLGLLVVPIGLNYLNADKFRSSVLVQVGEPIKVADYLETSGEKANDQAKKLTEKFRLSLESVLSNVRTKEEEKQVFEIVEMLKSKYYHDNFNSIEGELELFRMVRDKIEEFQLTQPWKINEIEDLISKIKWKIETLDVRVDFLDRKFRARMFIRQLVFSAVFALIGLPLFIFGIVHNYLQYKLTDLIIPKLTKDVEYYAPLAVLLGLILYPLFYTGFLEVINIFLDLTFIQKAMYFFSMPIAGLFAYFFYRYLKHINYKLNYITGMFKNKNALKDLQEDRIMLRSYFEM